MSRKAWFSVVAIAIVSATALSFVFWDEKGKPSRHARASVARTESENAAAGRQRLPRQRTATENRAQAVGATSKAAVDVVGEPEEAPSSAPQTPQQEDKREVVAAALEAEYAVDAPPTQEGLRKETALKSLFAGLNGIGQLQEVACREKVCRGVVRIASASADAEVFARTFLSSDYVRDIQDAVSVTSRQKQPDGAVLATFFIHPQAVFDLVATGASTNSESP